MAGSPAHGRMAELGFVLVAAGTLGASIAVTGAAMSVGEPAPTMPPPIIEPIEVAVEPVDIDDGRAPPVDVDLTSDLFAPAIDFRLRATKQPGADQGNEFCILDTSPTSVVLGHVTGCVDDIRIVRPSDVECGRLDRDPVAATLAEAILAKRSIGAIDRGPLVPGGNVPAALFATPLPGRVIDIPGTMTFDAQTDDPDHCLLAVDGLSDIELRRDLTARLVILDVGERLVVIRAGVGGHDRASAIAAHDRGYGTGALAARVESIDHMLEQIYAIRFH